MEQHVFQTGMSPVLIVEVEGDFKLKGEDVEEVTIQAASDDDLKVNQDGNQITIKCSSDLKVRAPRATSVKISQAYGDATLKAIDGEVKIETVHGNLNLRSVGPVHLGSVHGNLEARSVMGSLEVERVDGNLEARDIIGALQVKFTGGNLTIEDVEEAVDVKAEGNVIMRLDPNPGDDYSIKAGGNLTWKAPEDVSAKVEVRKADKIISSLSGVGPQRAPCSFTIGDGDALVVLEAQGNVMINPKGASLDFDFNFSAGENDAERIGLSPDAIAEQISLQLDTQMALLERQLDLEMARVATRLDSVGASPEQVERIQRRAREAGEQATQRAQEKMRLAQERLERKMAAVQQRVEQRAKQAEERAKQAEQRTQRRERRSWSFGFTMPEPPRPPTPPVPPRPPVAPGMPGVPGVAVDDKVSDDERLAVLRMLSAKKISLEQAEKLLAALEGKDA